MTHSHSAELVLAATAPAVHALLRDPARHHIVDASGTVGAPLTAEPIERVGQVFTMHMTGPDGVGHLSDNHVTAFVRDRRLEWETTVHGEGPSGGRWRYDLIPVWAGTRVRLTYDGTDSSPGMPTVGPDGLAASLDLLARAVRGR